MTIARGVALDATEYRIELTGLDWEGAGLRLGMQDDIEVPPLDTDSNQLTLAFSDGSTNAKRIDLCVLMRETTTAVWHLLVPRTEHGMGLGETGFDLHRVYAVFKEAAPTGRMGGGLDTQEFLEAVGVSPDSIKSNDDGISATTTLSSDLEALQGVEYATVSFRRM